ncbi:polynucleotide adenylyltransferase PcnB [Stigmatella sp. ncwal1]|uniref:Poly(A) polymerase I n=1 Tax=Stigmatella ashevillensis TaxID=2995309 RepID=A0ABT5DMN5_9BACT|nr:polynucleotide adenylyltransferase PcnB [Stigmatella ashevillena]MDC0714926.1 polynucleotide adenylyltransferase PcnB [Stigmatella ashevillena]
MTRDSTETPPADGPLLPAPDDAREATSPEVLTVFEPATEAPPMSEAALQADSLDLPLPTEPVEPRAESLEPPPEALAAEIASPEPELVAPTTTPTGEPPAIDPSKLDPDALKVVLRLHQHGHQAYLVGGCVRDLLLGRRPKDFDVATSAHPGEVRATFRNCRLIGRRFRLAHVYFKGGKIIEVSTFRANPLEMEPTEEEGAENGNGNGDDLLITHDNVFGTAEQDARRRDFTINGLFYDVTEGRVIDYVRGRRDLDERYIRTIGDPEIRMREDPVRILRAVRFASKLDLDIESRTYAAMEGAVEDLPRCAPARLLEETFRLIRGGVAAPSLKLLSALDALKILLPPVDAYLKRSRESERTFYAFAEALDRRVATGEPLDDAILLATLLVPISRAAPPPEEAEDAQPSVAQSIEDLLAGFVQSARLPRRIAERCRLLLLAQRTLSGERRRRGAAFRRHPLFGEALTVFELSVEATGEFREALGAWKSGEVPPARAEAPAAEEKAGRKRRRRRRRGGRKTGRSEAGSTEAGSAEVSEESPEGVEAEELESEDSEGDAEEPESSDSEP